MLDPQDLQCRARIGTGKSHMFETRPELLLEAVVNLRGLMGGLALKLNGLGFRV